ncbi:MAG: protease inhibitor I42 family protein, partial [bacterium]
PGRARAKRSVPPLLMMLTLGLAFLAGCASETPPDTVPARSTGTTAVDDAAPGSLELTEADDGGTFTVQLGGTIDLALKADPGTGYYWELDDPDPEASLLEQEGEPVFVPADPTAEDGAWILNYTFRAADKGAMVIRFVYLAPEFGEAPTKTFQIDLLVK